MYAFEIENTANKRICGWIYYSFRLESNDSNLVLFVSGRDRSDPAAHAKHYAQGDFNKKVK